MLTLARFNARAHPSNKKSSIINFATFWYTWWSFKQLCFYVTRIRTTAPLATAPLRPAPLFRPCANAASVPEQAWTPSSTNNAQRKKNRCIAIWIAAIVSCLSRSPNCSASASATEKRRSRTSSDSRAYQICRLVGECLDSCPALPLPVHHKYRYVSKNVINGI